MFSEEVNKTALSANNDKRIQSRDSVETYAFRTSMDLICKKEQAQCKYIINQCKI